MKMVFTGSSGQLASAMRQQRLVNGESLHFVGRPEVDLCYPERVRKAILEHQPDIVVAAAAMTDVDAAERDPPLAKRINVEGQRAVADAAKILSIPIIYLSSNYVFNGQLNTPYEETDSAYPLSVYGRTKLEGESVVAETNQKHVILRAGWIFSPTGRNFVKTVLDWAETRNECEIAVDRLGNPTAALDVAEVIMSVSRRLQRDSRPELYGTFHVASEGFCSLDEFAREIIKVSTNIAGPQLHVRNVRSTRFSTVASRPVNGCLATRKLKQCFGIELPPWRQSVAKTVTLILDERRRR